MTTCAESGTAILIFARAPVPGSTKTRLIPLIGAAAAARLQERMTLRAIATASEATLGPVQLWCTPSTSHPVFQSCLQTCDLTLHTQSGSSLGDRMQHAHRYAFHLHSRVLLIGTDCPLLTAAHLRAAAVGLVSHDAVIVPAQDGGYVLLGLARPCPEVFEGVDWGSDRVFAQTVERLRATRKSCLVQDMLWDVDRPEDYRHLVRALPELVSGLGPESS